MADGRTRQLATRRTALAAIGAGLGGVVIGRLELARASATGISTWDDLAAIGTSGEYVLESDLTPATDGYDDRVSTAGWDPISKFDGSLAGDGHVIEGLVVDAGDKAGLFGEVSGSVTALGIHDCDVTGGDNVGAVAGYVNTGTIERVVAHGSVSGNRWVGGLVGDLTGTLNDAYAHASANGDDAVGGLVGYLASTGTFERAVAVGSVQAPGDVGGLIGFNDGGTVVGTYWDRGQTGQADPVGSGSATGMTGFGSVGDSEPADTMQGVTPTPADGDTMPGLDFQATWQAVIEDSELPPTPAADGYPVLAAVDTAAQLAMQGIDTVTTSAAIRVENAESVTISNVTVDGSDE